MELKRELGLLDATMLGLGSILGTGVFVSVGIAAGVAGSSVTLAIGLAGIVAICNALSSAQLAASHPVSGGSYEYGYRYLHPILGFVAGWTFMFAKSASAATAALGFAGYLLLALGLPSNWMVMLGLFTVLVIMVVVLSGVRRSSQVNITIVSVTIISLLIFIGVGIQHVDKSNLTIRWEPVNLWHATALMFVAFTGYGRIATLGEEVRDPRRTIPKAIIMTLVVSMLLYMAVAVVAAGAVGSSSLATATQSQAAPLEFAASAFSGSVARVVSIGAITAMLGVLLNLLLGLSRVLLAMGRRGDMPATTAKLQPAIVIVGLLVAGLTLLGDVKLAWSFSAFTVLIYYAITNLAALQLPMESRLYPRAISVAGLLGCLTLAFAVDIYVWCFGLGLIGVGLIWYSVMRLVSKK